MSEQRSTVVYMPCSDYDPERVYQALKQGAALLGGPEKFVRPEEKILLKPNLLVRAVPEKAVTTHPSVFAAAVRLLREYGCEHLSYGDSPGNPVTTPEKAAEECGIRAVAEREHVEQADFRSSSAVAYPAGLRCKSFQLCKGVQDADAVINLCKMKTHALERITGAVKNLYGTVCGANKAAGHAKYPNSEVFADMLADLNGCVRPRLHIMDGITAMEGNGPTSGVPRDMHCLLLSADAVALDSVFACLVGLRPETVPTCVSGQRAGIGTMQTENIRVLTPDGECTAEELAQKYGCPDFDVYRGTMKKSLIKKVLPLLPCLQDRPTVIADKCIGCGLCEKACPVEGKAVHSGGGKKAKYDYAKCIRCFCCQEMCPEKAITVKHSRLGKLLSGK